MESKERKAKEAVSLGHTPHKTVFI